MDTKLKWNKISNYKEKKTIVIIEQWREGITRLMWSCLLVKNQAAAFCTSWRHDIFFGFNPKYNKLQSSNQDEIKAWSDHTAAGAWPTQTVHISLLPRHRLAGEWSRGSWCFTNYIIFNSWHQVLYLNPFFQVHYQHHGWIMLAGSKMICGLLLTTCVCRNFI